MMNGRLLDAVRYEWAIAGAGFLLKVYCLKMELTFEV
jgi:hypothetical protein